MELRPSLKARVVASLCLLSIVLAFQNCAKAPIQKSDLTDADYAKVEATQFSALSVQDHNRDLSLKVDLNSGAIEKSSASGTSGVEHRCLSMADRARLDAILLDASVCKPVQSRREGMCLQVYTEAYATLSDAGISVSLGEKPDSCAVAVDLCDGKASELRVFVEELKARVDGMNCN